VKVNLKETTTKPTLSKIQQTMVTIPIIVTMIEEATRQRRAIAITRTTHQRARAIFPVQKE
jgi:hypothetical protein